MPYPDGPALQGYLEEMGLAPENPSTSSLERRAKAAAADWERDSGWRPFLSSGLVESRTFHEAPNGLLDLRAGLLSLQSVTAGDVELVEGESFFVEQWGDVPEAIRLRRSVALPIVVAGVWGRVAEIPAEVEEAVLAKGALSFVPQTQGAGGELVREKAGPVEYQYSTSSTGGKASSLTAVYDAQIEAWRREAVA